MNTSKIEPLVVEELTRDVAARVCVVLPRRTWVYLNVTGFLIAFGDRVHSRTENTLTLKEAPPRPDPSIAVLGPNAPTTGNRYSFIVAPRDFNPDDTQGFYNPNHKDLAWFRESVLSRLIDGGRTVFV